MIQLICGDCLEVLPRLEAGSVDAVIADIPYGTTACAWDSVIPFDAMWRCIKHVIKPRGAVVLFGSQPFTSALVMSNPAWFRYEWVWEKESPKNPLVANIRVMPRHENILVFYQFQAHYQPQMEPRIKFRNNTPNSFKTETKGDATIFQSKGNTLLMHPNSVIKISSRVGRGLHPTQKPVALMEYLIKTYTNEGETVLDFTAGSGTTAVAAYKTGRKCIAIEKDAEYFQVMQRRVAEAQMQPMLELTA